MKVTPLRLNILIVAAFIAAICGGIIYLICIALRQSDDGNQFIMGALVGLLGAGLTGLAGLGTTLVNDGRSE